MEGQDKRVAVLCVVTAAAAATAAAATMLRDQQCVISVARSAMRDRRCAIGDASCPKNAHQATKPAFGTFLAAKSTMPNQHLQLQG
jgi:hypothetical protein